MSSARGEQGIRLRLDHVAIAVRGLEAARESWSRLLSAAASAPEEVPGEGVRVSFVGAANARVELLESARPDSAIARFLDRRPEGLHHLSFEVEGIDLDAWHAELRGRGVRLVGEAPVEGAEGTRVFFVHPSATGGVLVEFSQRERPGDAEVER